MDSKIPRKGTYWYRLSIKKLVQIVSCDDQEVTYSAVKCSIYKYITLNCFLHNYIPICVLDINKY